MRIALIQPNGIIGDFEGNTKNILRSIAEARSLGADLAVFPELSVCGYPPRDFLEFQHFIDQCEKAVDQIAKACCGIAAIVGSPVRNASGKGKPLYNAALFLYEGKIIGRQYKTLLPNYDIFDEYRYFEPNREFGVVEFQGQKIGMTICEDLWNTSSQPLYTQQPIHELAQLKPDLLINIAASPFHSHQHEARMEILQFAAHLVHVPLIYVNQVGAHTELLFDGGSMVLNEKGQTVLQMPFFHETTGYIDLPLTTSVTEETAMLTPIARIHEALVMGIREYFAKLGLKSAILGLSGGIDSAVVMALATRALGAGNVNGILLPSRYSSDHSVEDALKLARNLGCPHEIISIENAFRSFENTLSPWFHPLKPDLTEENLQARTRAVILMALSNKFGHILLNTSNKSEAAVGYGTLYGDMCGGLSVIGDLYKTQVYELARYINSEGEVIPENILTKAPSAELRPDQKDSDSLPEYDVLDQILEHYIENRLGPNEIAALGYDKQLVDRVLKLVNTSEYKRQQCPPILRVSSKAFGSGRRMPVVGKYLS